MRQVADHVLLHFLRSIEAKWRQIADIQFDDLLALVLHAPRLIDDRPPDVVQHIGQLGGFVNGFHYSVIQAPHPASAGSATNGALPWRRPKQAGAKS